MKKIIYLVFILFLSISCQKEIKPKYSVKNQVTLNFSCPDIDIVNSRSLSESQEKIIKDINIYFFDEHTNVCTYHYQSSSSTFNIELSPIDYIVYTIANYGSEIGNLSQSDIENLSAKIAEESDITGNSSLLMSNEQRVSISKNNHFNIVLKRAVAKFNINISNASDFDFKLHSVEVVNAPKDVSIFGNNDPKQLISYNAKKNANVDFYMFENLQGVKPSIKEASERNKDNAPPKATYLSIIGSYQNTRVEYSIYLGENDTSDFNIYRNKKYTYSINLNGINDVDSRVNVTTLTATDFNKSYFAGEDSAISTITLTANGNETNNYTMTYTLLEGNGKILINGLEQQPNVEVPFLNTGEVSKTVTLSYSQNSVSAVRIGVNARDNNGILFSKELVSNFIEKIYELEINAVTATKSIGGGKSIISYETTKKKYTGAVSMKYELLSGVGSIMYNDEPLANNTFVASSLGGAQLEFIPSELQDANIRITVKLESGETVSKEILVKVVKMEIEVREEVSGDRIYDVFYIDGVKNRSTILPKKSCHSIFCESYISWKCSSCGSSEGSNISSLIYDYYYFIRPSRPIKSDGIYILADSAPKSIVLNSRCGNPNCDEQNAVAVFESQYKRILVIDPNTTFVTFINIPIY